MQHRKSIRVLSLALLSAMLLVGCGGGNHSADTTVTDTTPTVSESEADTPTATLPETLPEPLPETQPESESETAEETRPPKDIVTFPDAELPAMSELLTGEDNSIRLDFDFVKQKFSTLKNDSRLNFVLQGSFADSEQGYVSDSSAWRSIGLTQMLPKKPYTVEAELTVAGTNASYTHTGMVGIHCKTSGHLFIDSGLWFCFIGDTVTAAVHPAGFTCKLEGLPFKASDGIRFRAEEADGVANIYANDLHIFRVVFGTDALTVYDSEENELGSCANDRVFTGEEGVGFFRVMAHFATATFRSMKLTVEDKIGYTPREEIFALRDGLTYGFRGLGAHMADGGVAVRDGILFVDSSMLADMLDFAHAADGETRTLTRSGVTVKLTADADSIKINDKAYDFTTTYAKDGAIMVDIKAFASMLGYDYSYEEASKTHYLFADASSLTEEKKQMANERFDLYRDVVYNYDDVECDNTGIGVFDPVPYEERIVGLAYSTWHYPGIVWGQSTWGTPLNGGYYSDNREVIYRHGVMLAEAGVDFIYVDWSNNTGYDPATMSHMMDFRTIEESTDVLFEVWSEIPNAPKICFLLGPGHSGISTVKDGKHQKKADQIFRDYVEKYPDLYFHYDGKPLVICYGATPTQYGANPTRVWQDDRYTIRWMTGYVGQQEQLFNADNLSSRFYWSWEERGTQTYAVRDGRVECVTVSPATRQQGAEGSDGYIPPAGRQNGATFKKQFQRAMNLGSGMVLLISWNEWHKGEHPSPEVSRDLEPSVEHGTFYYDLMREQIKKYKGLLPIEE